MIEPITLTTIGSRGVDVEATPSALPEAADGVTLWFRYKTGTPLESHSAYTFTADEARWLLAQIEDGLSS